MIAVMKAVANELGIVKAALAELVLLPLIKV